MGFAFYDKPPVAIERRQKRRDRKAHELDVKAEVRQRDGVGCRWPRCEFATTNQTIDAAHIEAAGMGGDPKSIRMRRNNLIRICRSHHRGPVSLHSGDLKIVPQTDQGTDGPCDFLRRDDRGRFVVIASEKTIGISVAVGR